MVAKNYIFGRKYGANFLTNLVGYYPLNSNANDLSGKGYNGTQVGTPTYGTGKVSNAIDFGNDSNLRYVSISDNNDFSFTDGTTDVPFSISFWVKISSFSASGNWFVNKMSAANDGNSEWQIIYFENKLNFYKYQFNNLNIAQRIQSSLTPFSLNTWYHICYTDNGTASIGSGKLYIDGVFNVALNQNVGGTYTRMNNGTFPTRIGQASWSISTTFKHRGLVDELAIWKNRELSATEVAELYTKGNAGNPII